MNYCLHFRETHRFPAVYMSYRKACGCQPNTQVAQHERLDCALGSNKQTASPYESDARDIHGPLSALPPFPTHSPCIARPRLQERRPASEPSPTRASRAESGSVRALTRRQPCVRKRARVVCWC